MPKITIIIPNYNHGRFLDQRIKSVLGQTFQDFEVIILDDASKDNSLEIISRHLADPRVRLFKNERNSGSPFVQWNKGISLAISKYVWIAESDDYAEPELLETLVAELEQQPLAALAYCQSIRVDENNVKTGTMLEWTDDLFGPRWRHKFVNDGRDECARYLLLRCTIPNASAVVFRRDAYPLDNRDAESMHVCGDWLTWAKILQQGKLVYIPKALNYFRTHAASARSTTKVWDWLRETCRVQKHIIAHSSPSKEAVTKAQAGTASQWRNLTRHIRSIGDFRIALDAAMIIPHYQNKSRIAVSLLAILEILSSPFRRLVRISLNWFARQG